MFPDGVINRMNVTIRGDNPDEVFAKVNAVWQVGVRDIMIMQKMPEAVIMVPMADAQGNIIVGRRVMIHRAPMRIVYTAQQRILMQPELLAM